MKKQFRQIYVEITNVCNFDCSFCAKHHRQYQYMEPELFRNIVQQIAPYTDLVYLHVMGEPLMHPDIGYLMDIVSEEGLQVGLTTNGILLPNIREQLYGKNIKRINLSLHSYYDGNNRVSSDTCGEVLDAADDVRNHTGATVFYRL
ncbi:MAG: radical SAM protein, partial [Erysipelotrichaceae bacterium]|nr:radical SAM protein [Erysipelotrichaceae bacterium]